VCIDCAQERVFDECKKRGLEPKFVLLTHGHYDHIGGCGVMQENGAKIICGENEVKLVSSRDNLAVISGTKIGKFTIDSTLKDGEEIELCGMKIKTIATPGHTAGGISYIVENNLFTGDTLFLESVGRTDLPTGNARQLIDSVRKLFSLDGDFKVYCGHEDDTTLDYERKNNPYVRL
jgi:glyoxylase-like metal-dependent hydrolase (beta-lactamase superfamily II)